MITIMIAAGLCRGLARGSVEAAAGRREAAAAAEEREARQAQGLR